MRGVEIFIYLCDMTKVGHQLVLWLSAVVLSLMASCGGRENLKITADIDGLGTQNVNLTYYTRSGLKTVSIPVVDGHLEYSYVSDEPLLIELTTGGGRLIGHLVAKNGQSVSAAYKLGDMSATTVKGDAVSKRLAEFCAANAAYIDSLNPQKLNGAIAKYVTENPDDQVSAILMSRYYDSTIDPAGASELLSGISASARPAAFVAGLSELLNVSPDSVATLTELTLYGRGDSLVTVAPHDSIGLLLAVSAVNDVRMPRDTAVARLNAAADSLKNRLAVVELIVAPDTAGWHEACRGAKTDYRIGWLPGGIASPAVRHLNIKSVPAVLVADSCGNIVYRGASLEEAVKQFTIEK